MKEKQTSRIRDYVPFYSFSNVMRIVLVELMSCTKRIDKDNFMEALHQLRYGF